MNWVCPICGYDDTELATFVGRRDQPEGIQFLYRCASGHLFGVAFDVPALPEPAPSPG